MEGERRRGTVEALIQSAIAVHQCAGELDFLALLVADVTGAIVELHQHTPVIEAFVDHLETVSTATSIHHQNSTQECSWSHTIAAVSQSFPSSTFSPLAELRLKLLQEPGSPRQIRCSTQECCELSASSDWRENEMQASKAIKAFSAILVMIFEIATI